MPQTEYVIGDLGHLCNRVRRVAVEAGEITRKYFKMEGTEHIEAKSDGSPVSLADREAETLIQIQLERITPGIPIIGEESAELGKLPDLTGAEYFWLVDPLDGTKEFITGGGDYTVNIALVKGTQPVLGIVHAPAVGKLYAGYEGGEAVIWDEEEDKEQKISVRQAPKEGLVVVSSKSHGDKGKLDKFMQNFKVSEVIERGSSLKICAIAEGKADIYPRFGPTCEWDTAAGDAVLRTAGGVLTDVDGNPLKYGGHNPKFLNPEFVACSFEWFKKKDVA